MSHDIYRDHFLHAHGTPAAWHRIGTMLKEGATIDDLMATPAFNWSILSGVPAVTTADGTVITFDDKQGLYRSDTGESLAIVGDGFKVVQPADVATWFQSLVDDNGMQIETAGMLKGGRQFWVLATTGEAASINGDTFKRYMLLATANDGSMASTARDTATRVVCANTMAVSLREKGGKEAKLTHRSAWNGGDSLKRELGLLKESTDDWRHYIETMREFVETPMTGKDTLRFFADLADPERTYAKEGAEYDKARKSTERWLKRIGEDYVNGAGQDHENCKGTAYGALQAVTHHTDHSMRARSDENRVSSSWFGPGNDMKARAVDMLRGYSAEHHSPGNAVITYEQATHQAAAAIEPEPEYADGSDILGALLNKSVRLSDFETGNYQ